MGEAVSHWNQKKLIDFMTQREIIWKFNPREIIWKFNPPSAPHFGGSLERLIQSVESAIRIVLNQVTVSDEILLTAFAEIEVLLNARSLTNVPVDPTDPEVLTPNHFLLGCVSPSLAPVVVSDQDLSARKRWKISQVLANQFWRRWVNEYGRI